MSIIGHLNASAASNGSEGGKQISPASLESNSNNPIRASDLFDLSKPWVLVPGGSFKNFFNFVPSDLREGPWSPTATISVIVILSFLTKEGLESFQSGDFLRYFEEATSKHEYTAFTWEWYLSLSCFCWTLFVCWHILKYSVLKAKAWITFTVWSWTTIVIRSGLAVAAPFLPAARIPMDMLRFPTLLSATLTFFMWNFVLFPIILVFIREPEKKENFLKYMTQWRLIQLHVCNIAYASFCTIEAGPKRALHFGDAVAAGIMLVLYICWYYFVLDRIGIHLYPIFSPRTPLVVFSYALLLGMCYVSYQGWQMVLEKEHSTIVSTLHVGCVGGSVIWFSLNRTSPAVATTPSPSVEKDGPR